MRAEPAYVRTMPQAMMTAEELLHVSMPDKGTELVRGVLVVHEPPGFRHGEVVARITSALARHADAHGLGTVVAGDAGFVLARNPDTVRGPDVAFVRRERLPHPSPVGFADLAPDLAVEVLSPSNRPGEVLARVADLITAGTALVWVIDPVRRLARVYRQDGSESGVAADGALEGEDMLPGFTCRLETIL
jgi:Uma2 family endonuclease